MTNELCYSKTYCKKYGKEDCHEDCMLYIILKALYSESNIPLMYREDVKMNAPKCDLENYKKLNTYREDVLLNIRKGKGLYIWGDMTGNGKTTWATKIVNYYFRKIIFSTGIENEAVYINVPTFLEELRANYGKNEIEFEWLMEKIYRSKLAIFDDIGSERPSEWVVERLYTIINHRVSNGLSTIYTSNVDLNELGSRLGMRIRSRVEGSTEEIKLVGQDQRIGGK